MTIFKCKMCSAPIEITNDMTVCECETCGTKQTLPKLDNELKVNLYDRANDFRRNNEYDKAMGIYKQILSEDVTDAEAYWSLVLCRYGIEYREDAFTHKRMPVMNRTQYTSVFDDPNYRMALKYADTMQREMYENEANVFNELQKEILASAQEEEPFDIFLCYKDADDDGRRTKDSVLATDLYQALTNEGFKVFFERITLENKSGILCEPYIFSALNSAKVMIAIGTKPEYFNATWVKNEWSRYLALIKRGQKKMLIPVYQDMAEYDLPVEFSHLQAQDMESPDFTNRLIKKIKKLVPNRDSENDLGKIIYNPESLLKRMNMFLEDAEWAKADEYAERALDLNPECVEAYLGKLLAELQVSVKEDLRVVKFPFDHSKNYQKVMRFGDEELKNELDEYIDYIYRRNELNRLESTYKQAKNQMAKDSESDYELAARLLKKISGWRDADQLYDECMQELEFIKKRKRRRILMACIIVFMILFMIAIIDIRILQLIIFIFMLGVLFLAYKLFTKK